jgi:hypothetical protein
MQLIVPFASALDDGARDALRRIDWKPLAAFDAAQRIGRDAWSLTPPHERALADALGLPGDDGLIPWAAHEARAMGLSLGDAPLARLTPCHWMVGRDHVRLADPAGLGLTDDESRALFDALWPLFADDGIALHWAGAQRWFAAHADFDGLACGSIDRAAGRSVDVWLPAGPGARRIRRLQSEVQMLLYTHPVNAAREARGALAVNSFWIDGCGRAQTAQAVDVGVDARLRESALAGDWNAWTAQWRALIGSIGAPVTTLTLCGERFAQTYERRERAWWQRLGARGTPPGAEGLTLL